MDVKKMIGLRIKEDREKLGWSLQTLASHTETLSKSRIGNYEQGTRRPSREAAIELSRALGKPASRYLLADEQSTMTEDERVLLEKYRLADERGKRSIQRLAQSESDQAIGPNGDRKKKRA